MYLLLGTLKTPCDAGDFIILTFLDAYLAIFQDPDPLIASDLMDGRDTFLTRARDEHWEFSSLRRAKYSTICFCHALHNQEKSEGLSYTCNSCQGTAVWHCTTCEVSIYIPDKAGNGVK